MMPYLLAGLPGNPFKLTPLGQLSVNRKSVSSQCIVDPILHVHSCFKCLGYSGRGWAPDSGLITVQFFYVFFYWNIKCINIETFLTTLIPNFRSRFWTTSSDPLFTFILFL